MRQLIIVEKKQSYFFTEEGELDLRWKDIQQ